MKFIATVEDEQALEWVLAMQEWDGVTVEAAEGRRAKPAPTGKQPSSAKRHPHTRTRWTEEQTVRLFTMHDEDRSVAYMARELGRTQNAINSKLWEIETGALEDPRGPRSTSKAG